MRLNRFQTTIIAAVFCVLLMATGCFAPKPFDEDAWREKYESADAKALYAKHRRSDGLFFNPWMPQPEKSALDLLRWKLFSKNSVPDQNGRFEKAPVVANNAAYLKDPGAPTSITWVGHATYVMQMDRRVFITDPFFSERAFLPKRLLPPAFGPEALPEGLIVLISHNHYDHLDADSIEALAQKASLMICPLGLGEFLKEHGAKKVRELNWWQKLKVGETTITCLPAQHWSRRWGMGTNETLWCSFMLEGQGLKIYYGADSGYFMGFAEIGRLYPGIDAALLGVGATHPRWMMHYAHMDVSETVLAFHDLKPRFLVPTQWGVIKLGDEPAAYPAELLRRAAKKDAALKKALRLLPVGGRLMLKPRKE